MEADRAQKAKDECLMELVPVRGWGGGGRGRARGGGRRGGGCVHVCSRAWGLSRGRRRRGRARVVLSSTGVAHAREGA